MLGACPAGPKTTNSGSNGILDAAITIPASKLPAFKGRPLMQIRKETRYGNSVWDLATMKIWSHIGTGARNLAEPATQRGITTGKLSWGWPSQNICKLRVMKNVLSFRCTTAQCPAGGEASCLFQHGQRSRAISKIAVTC